jgi:ATP-binding cassette subfamily B protein
MNPGMSWIVVVSVILLLLMQVFMFSKVVPRFKLMQKLRDKLNLVARESLTGMMVIRAFGNEHREEARFGEANDAIRKNNRYVQMIMAVQNPLIQFLLGCTTLAVFYFGTRAIDAGQLKVGQMMAFTQYVMQIIQSFMMISMMFIMIPQALVSANRLKEVLDTNSKITDKPKGQLKTLAGRAKGQVEFRDVTFTYQDAEAPVLANISFTAKAGEMTAFIGSTGSGKSTLINLIPRFYDATGGSITLDGVDIRDLSIKELRDNLGYVPQKGVLFSGDIGSNLSFGKEDGTEAEFREALKVAQAESFVFADKDGLHTQIAQSGDNVSGGQRQRLSIARALVKKPPVYIFDDSFSALDFRTDAALRRALRDYTGGATTLVVAQRVSTIMNAQQIIVLDAGKIIGKGTHRELLDTCEEYREIAESQLSKEELQ